MRTLIQGFRKGLLLLLAALALLALAIQITGHGYFWRALAATYVQGHTTAHIDDASNFAQRTIATGPVQS